MFPENHFVAVHAGRLVHEAPTIEDLLRGLRSRGVDERGVVIEFVAPAAARRRVF